MTMTEMPRPGAAHARLQKICGSWRGEETMHPSPWDPKGGSAIGRVDNRTALAGFAVIQDYAQERDGEVVYQAHGIFTWEPTTEKVHLHWFDAYGGKHELFVGDFDGATLSLVSQGRHRSRATWRFDGDRYTYSMEVSPDGERWHVFCEGAYRRIDDSAG